MSIQFSSRIRVQDAAQLKQYEPMRKEMVPTRYSMNRFPQTFLTNRDYRHADAFKSLMEAMKVGASPLVLNERQDTIRKMFETLPSDQLDMLCLALENIKNRLRQEMTAALNRF